MSAQTSVLADATVNRIRERGERSRDPWFRCVTEEQLIFGRELGKALPPFITVAEAFEELRLHINTARDLPRTKLGTLDAARRAHRETNEVLRRLACA